MITQCKTLEDCQKALYKAYDEDINAILDLDPGIDADKVHVMIGTCTQCDANKVLHQLGIETPTPCPACGEEIDWDHVIDMVVQCDVVVYRWQDDFEVGP
jgi:predicted RNA-binding Zn-ribbon protein involved in translation (DUF1610 family)